MPRADLLAPAALAYAPEPPWLMKAAAIMLGSLALMLAACAPKSVVEQAEDRTVDKLEQGKDAFNRGDYTMALNSFAPLAAAGEAEAQYDLGFIYSNGFGVPVNGPEALQWYRQSAAQNYARAQNILGVCYGEGEIGLTKDPVEAIRWYKLAADQGLAVAQFDLGAMYQFGYGVPQDYAEARRLLLLAAGQGDVNAENELAGMYLQGQGGPPDYAEALVWYKSAAQEGLADSQRALGVMYVQGLGVAQDYTEAFRWFSLGAEQGDVESLYYVGSMQINGNGALKDPVQAYMYLKLAAQAGFARASAELLFLRAKMSAEDIAEAESLADKWTPKIKLPTLDFLRARGEGQRAVL
jgi:uncharacterized protein